MPTLITDEFESYFVEEISAKVEDIRGCMPITSFGKMDLEGVFLEKNNQNKYYSHWSLLQFPVAATTNYCQQVPQNNSNLSLISGGQSLKSSVLGATVPLETLGQNPLASSSF